MKASSAYLFSAWSARLLSGTLLEHLQHCVQIEFLRPMTACILSERRAVRPFGIMGGGAALAGVNLLLTADGRQVSLGGKNDVQLKGGERLRILTPGGMLPSMCCEGADHQVWSAIRKPTRHAGLSDGCSCAAMYMARHEGADVCVQEAEALGSRTQGLWRMLIVPNRTGLPSSKLNSSKRTTAQLHMSVAV